MSAILTRGLALVLAGALAAYPAAAAAPAPNRELTTGVSLVKAGDFEAAIPALSAAIQALSPDLKRRAELSQAFLYLGVAYLELGQELEARGKFREAIRNDPKLKLSPQEFSGQVRRVFEAEQQAAEPQKKRRNLLLPLVLVVGGGAASAGIAIASGSNPPSTSAAATTTTTTTMSGGPGPTTTTTAPPGPDPTTPGSTTTTTTSSTTPTSTSTLPPTSTTSSTTPTSTTSTTTTSTTTTTTTTTSTTTATTMPPCRYSAAPDMAFIVVGGTGTCNIDVTPAGCAWNAEVAYMSGGSGWITLTSPAAGVGDGQVNYSVAALALATRQARIRVTEDPSAACRITQALTFRDTSDGQLAWASQLDLPGGRGQVLVNGTESYGQDGVLLGRGRASRAGWNRIEAHLVRGGRPGTWTFEILSGLDPGSLRSLTGKAVLAGPDRIVFQLSGEPGERVAFVFRSAR